MHKRPMNKLMAAFKGVFLSLFHKNTGLRSLFNIKLYIRFYIVYLSRLIININTLKKCVKRRNVESVVITQKKSESSQRESNP